MAHKLFDRAVIQGDKGNALEMQTLAGACEEKEQIIEKRKLTVRCKLVMQSSASTSLATSAEPWLHKRQYTKKMPLERI
jgi:hypothetical protein